MVGNLTGYSQSHFNIIYVADHPLTRLIVITRDNLNLQNTKLQILNRFFYDLPFHVSNHWMQIRMGFNKMHFVLQYLLNKFVVTILNGIFFSHGIIFVP